ncbi:MAG: PilT/PilU family type 4a pilus ATPase [Lachnospiraceae bacterium]|jgi:twitching motility protein PilT|nr:PilT/PilU family type 4a pilus ATPase [Lachnospiraceae bacterium]
MDLDTLQILKTAVNRGATDIFIVAGHAVSMRVNGLISPEEDLNERPLEPADCEALIKKIYDLAGRTMEKLKEEGDDDFSFSIRGFSRFRINAYKQRGSLAAVIRTITFEIPKAEDMHIPDQVIRLGAVNKGMVLVTGPAGSGKSTTLACIIDYINRNMARNIITLEDPIEYLHKHDKSLISQREIHIDTESYLTGLRSTLRQSPDVILLGEMRDYETIATAMTAAETGHLIFSTLHTIGAANTINRIIDVFPAEQQRQIAVQLSMVLTAVVSQQLIPTVDGGLIPAFEIMIVNPAIRNMIRTDKIFQIDTVIAGDKEMQTMDSCLLGYYRAGRISKEVMLEKAANPEVLERKL